jgi:hypothetical protein
VQLGNFTGPVERIRIHSNGRADCDKVGVTYENGDTQEVFSGVILDGQDQTITFPDQSRRVQAVSLNCRAEHEDGARLAVAADMPAFTPAGSYSRAVTPAGDLVLLASRDFGDLDQRTLMLGDSEPRAVRDIVLEPVGADARCRNVSARFDDGTTARAVPNGGDNLYEGRMYHAYIGSGNRDLSSINLTCEAENGDYVKINIYAAG